MDNPEIIWQPSNESKKSSNLSRFIELVNQRYSRSIATEYQDIWNWSVNNVESFWSLIWDFSEIKGRKGTKISENLGLMPGAKFFPEAKLNYAENLLRTPDDALAVEEFREDGFSNKLTRKELESKALKMAGWLKTNGIKKGDRVCAYMPNCSETIITMLATSALGAIFSSCSSDFGIEGVIDRFEQIKPKILVAANGYLYNGKLIDRVEEIRSVSERLPSLELVLIVDYISSKKDTNSFTKFNSVFQSDPLKKYVLCEFNDPLYIVFSSGTTGKPKCITHSIGGVLIQHAKEHLLHINLSEKEKMFYFTTCGWMMWNWLVGSLFCRSSIILYEGSPFYPNSECLWKIAERSSVDVFGISAKYVDTLSKSNIIPKSQFNLRSLRTICSTGSPLSPDSFDYILNNIKSDVQIASISGGTDLLSCFVLSNPLSPVFTGEIQCRALGMHVDILDENGKSLIDKEGELVCKNSFPSMPIMFWNDQNNRKYKEAYFEKFSNIWCHGDWAKITKRGTIVIYGRSDATLNPGGVRIGTAEIYNTVEKLDEVVESLVIAQDWNSDVRIILFLTLRDEFVLTQHLKEKVIYQIRKNLTPRHIPAKIIAVPDIPRTRSGKITELAVRDIIHGRTVKNKEALLNAEALEYFENLSELNDE
ncbi:acetoacetate--CoA ligase [Paracoccaceae bacterium]|nr:acetoacetate--CoA ligase [Paracoccaceae bacterium]